MAIVLIETQLRRKTFYPLTFTQAFANMQIGILSLKDWWEKLTGEIVYIETATYLQEALPYEGEDVFIIDSFILPSYSLWLEIQNLKSETQLHSSSNNFIASKKPWQLDNKIQNENARIINSSLEVQFVKSPAHLLKLHHEIIEHQFALITNDRLSKKISTTNNIISPENIFIEEGVQMEYTTLNATNGKIYIAQNACIMEGSLIRGTFALGKESVVKMGSKIYGATSTGRKCILGGEIKNTIFNHCSNKGHEGYLGDSIIGNWCNFGAGSSNSNLKNTAGAVLQYNYQTNSFDKVGNKMGLLLGDYSRLAINSSINTGSSFGVCGNIFSHQLLPKVIQNFSWGIDNHTTKYKLEKAIEHIQNWMQLKHERLGDKEISILQYIFEHPEI